MFSDARQFAQMRQSILTDGTCVSAPASLRGPLRAPRVGNRAAREEVLGPLALSHTGCVWQNSLPGWEVTWEPQGAKDDPDCKAFPMFNENVCGRMPLHEPSAWPCECASA